MSRLFLRVESPRQITGGTGLRETRSRVGRYLRRLLTWSGRLVLMLRVLRN